MSRPGLPSTAACYEGGDEARALYEWNHAKQLLRITAGRREEPTVLLIDETDKADVEIEGLLLEERIVRLKVPRIDTVLVESIVRVVNALRDMELRKAPSVAETIDWARTLVALVGALRRQGVRAGTSETVDAAAVVEVLGIDERDRSREGLASALIRRGGQRSVFDAVFDLLLPDGGRLVVFRTREPNAGGRRAAACRARVRAGLTRLPSTTPHRAAGPVRHPTAADLIDGVVHGGAHDGSPMTSRLGCPNRKPWACGHPCSMSQFACATVSTPSAMTSTPRLDPR